MRSRRPRAPTSPTATAAAPTSSTSLSCPSTPTWKVSPSPAVSCLEPRRRSPSKTSSATAAPPLPARRRCRAVSRAAPRSLPDRSTSTAASSARPKTWPTMSARSRRRRSHAPLCSAAACSMRLSRPCTTTSRCRRHLAPVVAAATLTGRADPNHANDTSTVTIDVDAPAAEIYTQIVSVVERYLRRRCRSSRGPSGQCRRDRRP